MKKILILVLLSALVVAGYFLFDYFSVKRITANELSIVYQSSKADADEKYLGSRVEVTGVVKAYYEMLGTRKVLEFETGAEKPVFCFFNNEPLEFKASQLLQGQKITVIGTCVGEDKYNFIKGIKIDVYDILD
ncbi:MAG: hypothetical protein HXY49_11280 [Ignavibacteriaceae bacterium]|jgi:hypothetical protein|nr:hypothetical protein [Ignavibacteriaceae bacterium]